MNKKIMILVSVLTILSFHHMPSAKAARPIVKEAGKTLTQTPGQPPTPADHGISYTRVNLKSIAAQLPLATDLGSKKKSRTSDAHIEQILGSVSSPRASAKQITIIRRDGGRIDWSPEHDLVAIDRKGPGNYYNVFLITPDGTKEKCLTCNTGGVLSEGHQGQPAWHPSGNFLVFQSQKKKFTGGWGRDLSATPGFGQFCDLWLWDIRTNRFYQLTHTEDKKGTGVLHPHFSHDGTKLTWSQLYEKTGPMGLGAGNWKLKIADFGFQNGVPELTNIQSFEPGGPSFYENHGTSPDDRKLLFTGSFEWDGKGDWFKSTRIYLLDLYTNGLKKLTYEPSWHEHALYNPANGRIVWMTGKQNQSGGTDYWSMNPDGSDKRRITDYNHGALPTHRGKKIVSADASFSPDGTQLMAYLQTDLATQDGLTVLIDLEKPEKEAETVQPAPPPPPQQKSHQGPQRARMPGAIGPKITMKSGVYNPWTDRCSGERGPVRRKMYVRQPAQPGEYPVFLFLIGTLRKYDNQAARKIVDRAAERGFVAAAVDYDTMAAKFKKRDTCDSPQSKAKCTFAAPESALNLICNNVNIDGRKAGLYTDCDKGIVVVGFSQGGTLAMMSRRYDPRVQAVWVLGFHDQALLDKQPLKCLHKDTRALPSNRLRVIVGEGDKMLRGPHQRHLQAVTGRTCSPGTRTCFTQGGSGWGIVPNSECGGNCKHEHLDTDAFLDESRWWGLEQNLDWLESFVKK